MPALYEPIDSFQLALDANALLSVSFSCDRFEDVMTSWALGPEDKAGVWATFLCEHAASMPSLREAYWTLANARRGRRAQLPDGGAVSNCFLRRVCAWLVGLLLLRSWGYPSASSLSALLRSIQLPSKTLATRERPTIQHPRVPDYRPHC